MVMRRSPSLLAIWFVVFFDFLATEIILSLYQDYLVGFFNHGDQCLGSEDTSQECHQAASKVEQIVGWSGSVSAVVAFALSPFMGSVSDAYGRVKPLIVVELFVTLIPCCLLLINCYFGVSLWIWIVWRASSQGFSSMTLAFAYVADLTDGHSRTIHFGGLMAAFSLAGVLGPLLATYCSLSETIVFTIGTGSSFLAVLITIFMLGESLSEELQEEKRKQIAKEYYAKNKEEEEDDDVVSSMIVPIGPNHLQVQVQSASTNSLNEPLLIVSSGDSSSTSSTSSSSIPEFSFSDRSIDQQHGSSSSSTIVGGGGGGASRFTCKLICANPLYDTNMTRHTHTLARTFVIKDDDGVNNYPKGVSLNPLSLSLPLSPFISLSFSRSVLILNRSNSLRFLAIITLFLLMVIFGEMTIFYPYFHSRFDMTQKEHSIFSVVFGLIGVIVQSFGLALCLKFMSNKTIMIVGLIFLGLTSIFTGLMWMGDLSFAIAVGISFAGLSFPAITALKANAMGPDEQGAIQGALGAVRSIGSGFGPLVFNQLLSSTQNTNLYGLAFYVGAGMCLIAVLVSLLVPGETVPPPSKMIGSLVHDTDVSSTSIDTTINDTHDVHHDIHSPLDEAFDETHTNRMILTPAEAAFH